MTTDHRARLLGVALTAGALAVAALALPVLGEAGRVRGEGVAAPAASGGDPSPAASGKPGKGPKGERVRVPETPVTLTGSVGTATGTDGDTTYTLTVGSTVYTLEAGPPWWWGDANPLKPFVGKTATVAGDQAQGTTSVDVRTVNGTAIRDAGRPPWAGGWKAVGQKHPGWAQWKADKAAAKGFPGHGPPPWAGTKASEPPDAEASPDD